MQIAYCHIEALNILLDVRCEPWFAKHVLVALDIVRKYLSFLRIRCFQNGRCQCSDIDRSPLAITAIDWIIIGTNRRSEMWWCRSEIDPVEWKDYLIRKAAISATVESRLSRVVAGHFISAGLGRAIFIRQAVFDYGASRHDLLLALRG